jgi:predicted amidophosphoribosyltransferase
MPATRQEIRAALAIQQVRREFAPEPNQAGAAQSFCRGCQKPFWRWVRESRVYCSDCAFHRQVTANDRPAHLLERDERRRVLGQLRYWGRVAREMGLDLEDALKG